MARSNIKFPSDYVVKYVNRPMLSGLFEGRSDYLEMQQNEEFDDVVLVEKDGQGGWTRKPWEPNKRLLGSLGDWKTWYYPVEPGNELCTPTPVGCRLDNPCVSIQQGNWNPPRTQYARMYTGEMAQVAQMLFGMGKHMPYRYCWVRTHGIFVAANGDRWVIEISIDDGVTAWKLKTVKSENSGGLGYRPVADESLPYLADRKVLMPASGMAGFYDPSQQYFFKECGWAFNGDGHKAVNLTWDFVDTGPPPDGIVSKRSSVWDITITEADNEPESATIVQDGPYYLYNEIHAQNSVKYPTYGPSGACFVSLFVSFPDDTKPPNFDRAPVYAYYERGSDNRIVWWMNVTETTHTPVDGRPSGDKYGCLQGLGFWAPYSGGSGSYDYGTDSLSGVVWFEMEGGSRNLPPLQPYYTGRSSNYSYQWIRRGDWITANDLTGNPSIFSEHWELQETLVEHNYSEPSRWEQLLIPFHDRASAYLLQAMSDSTGADVHITTTTTACLSYAKGDYYDDAATATYRPFLPEPNPCDCEVSGPTAPPIGRWSYDMTPAGNVNGQYIGTSSGIFLQGPQVDPNRGDRMLFCFDGPRSTGETTNGCSWSSSCKCIEDTDQNIQDPATLGHVKMDFHADGQIHRVIDDAFDFTTYDPYWKFIESPGQDGCQYMDVTLDAFSGIGTIAVDILDPLVFTSRLVLGNADSYFPLDEVNLREHGYVGIPYPELLP